MELKPPAEFNPDRLAQWLASRQVAWILVAVIVITGWQVFELPGHFVRRHIPPTDRPWYAHGLRTAFLTAEGLLVIKRRGYIDRKGTYIYSQDDGFSTEDDDDLGYLQNDASGIYRGSRKHTRTMTGVELNPSSQYHFWLSAVRAHADDPVRVADIIAGDGSEFVTGPLAVEEPYVEVVLYGDGTSSFKRLAEQQYYPVFDCAAWHEPYLWVTTGRATRLSLLRIDETEPEVVELKSVEINAGIPAETNTILGHDRQKNELFLLTADGKRRWLDPLSLEQTGEDQLEGEWRFEQGALGFVDEQYSFHLGLPLTGEVYQRTMQVLMVLFLAGLLGLSIIWSKRWMYTLDQTTGDTKPESS